MSERTIRILDTTLRDGEQTPGVSLTPQEKLEIAKALDRLGVDVIEAGFPITSKGEQEGIRAISKAGLRAEVCGLARAEKVDIDTRGVLDRPRCRRLRRRARRHPPGRSVEHLR